MKNIIFVPIKDYFASRKKLYNKFIIRDYEKISVN